MGALIGLDIGTTSICGVAVAPGGEVIACVERPNDSAVEGLPAGRFEQDPTRIRRQAFHVLRRLAAGVGKIDGIGLTGQMHGMLSVDATCRPLGNFITWQDQRCLEAEASGRETWLDQMVERAGPEAWEPCGCAPATGFLGSTLFWLQKNDAVPHDAKRACFIQDWIAAQLTGALPTTDPTDAASSGVYDTRAGEWCSDLIESLGLPVDLLPPVGPSGDVIGAVSAAASSETGIPVGTPVCNALGDNQASFLGSSADPDNSVLINIGTGGQISWTVPEFARADGVETRPLPPDRFLLVGAGLCGGRAYRWLNDAVRQWLTPFGLDADPEAVYERLNALAAEAPARCDGLAADTVLAGSRTDLGRRGSFTGIGLDNFSLGHVARAVLEGTVDELCSQYERARTDDSRGERLVIAAGNAVRKNPVLREILSERMKATVRVPRHREAAAFGAALAAGVGTGAIADWQEAGNWVRCEGETETRT